MLKILMISNNRNTTITILKVGEKFIRKKLLIIRNVLIKWPKSNNRDHFVKGSMWIKFNVNFFQG